MSKSLREIAEIVDGIVEGDETVIIEGICGIKDAEPGQITFLANPKYLPMLSTTGASAVIVARDAPACDKNLVRTENPYLAFTQVLKLFAAAPPKPSGIHPGAIIGQNVSLGEDVALHTGVILEDGSAVGDRSVLYPGVFVGRGASVGADCAIYPRVVIFDSTLVGSRVIIHSGAVIGGRPRPGAAGQAGDKPAGGTAVVEDDVEIGAGVTIDCAREGATIIGRGTKIDNLVHIGADSSLGCNCIIVAQAAIGSRCNLGDGVTMAGQAGVVDDVTVGAGAIVAAKAGVMDDVDENQIVSGLPAYNHEKWLRMVASVRRLPTMVKDIREFKKRLGAMDDPDDG